LQRGDLVVDLLQRAGGRQDILRIIIGIEHDDLRQGWHCGAGHRECDDARRRELTDADLSFGLQY